MAPKLVFFVIVVLNGLEGYHQQGIENIINKNNETSTLDNTITKSRTLFDYQTRIAAYKDLTESRCLLEGIHNTEGTLSNNISKNGKSNLTKNVYISNKLSKRQIYRLAGQRITDFCRGFPTYFIKVINQEDQNTDVDYMNDLPMDEENINMEKLRVKRSTKHFFVGRVRGQTQSQYLNFANNGSEPGKAEAESTHEGSKAVVTGSSGMGQAQSQTHPLDCEDCYGRGQGGGYDQNQALQYSPGGRGYDASVPGSRPGYDRGRYDGTGYQQPTIEGGGETPGGTPGGRPEGGPLGPEQTGPGTIIHPSTGLGVPGYGPGGRPTGPGTIIQPSTEFGAPGQTPGGRSDGGPSGPGTIIHPSTEFGGPAQTSGGRYDGRPSGPPTEFGEGGQTGYPSPTGQIPGGYPGHTVQTPGGSTIQTGQIPAGYPGYIPTTSGQVPGRYPTETRGSGQTAGGYPSSGQIPEGYPTQTGGYPPTSSGQFIPVPGQIDLSHPGQYVAAGQRPGGIYNIPPGYRPGETQPTARGNYPIPPGYRPGDHLYPGKFQGDLAGGYQGAAGHSGRFSGTFSGQYEATHGGAGQFGSSGVADKTPTGQQGYYPSGGRQDRYPGTAGGQPIGQYVSGTDGRYPGAGGPGQFYPPTHGEVPAYGVGTNGRHVGGAQGQPGQYGGYIQGPGTGGTIGQQGGGATPDGRYTGTGQQGPNQYGPGVAGQPQYGGTIAGSDQLGQQGTGLGPDGRYAGTGQVPGGTGTQGVAGQPQYGTGGGTIAGGIGPDGRYAGTGQVPGGTGTQGAAGPPQYGAGGGTIASANQLGQHGGGISPDGRYTGTGTQGVAGPPGGQPGQYQIPAGPGTYGGYTPGGTGIYNGAAGPVQYGPQGGYGGVVGGSQGTYGPGAQGQYGESGVPAEYGTGPAGGRYAQAPSQLTDDADSNVQTSVQQTSNGTQAAAQAQGKFAGGTAQSQVSGTYTSGGSFSASAGSDDGKRGAQTQVAGGKDGAQSSAQGRGGQGQSQAQVVLSSETGDTLSSAQSGGVNHGTQTQVQASGKGGLADAQANGPGSTSSQAQIGFSPHDDKDEDNQRIPFRGGGTASAQGGTYSGLTQTQIQGKFRKGIRYTGAAQAGSGPAALSFNQSRPAGFAPFAPIKFGKKPESSNSGHQVQQLENASPKIRHSDLTGVSEEAPDETRITTTVVPEGENDYNEEDYDDNEYNDDTTDKPASKTVISQKSKGQRQQIVLDPLENLDATIYQSTGDDTPKDGTVLQPGQTIPGSPGYQIPIGFRGRVKSIASGPNTYSIGRNSHAQSVNLSPGHGRIIYRRPVYAVASKTLLRNGQFGYGSGYSYQPVQYQIKSGTALPNFVSVSTSETGSRDLYTGEKKPKVFYTQSSSCGVFTNSCIFNGSGRLCTPKRKINPDGSLMGC